MDVLDISEGTGGQLALMNIYEKYISMFKDVVEASCYFIDRQR